jgi:acetyl esterase
MTLALWWPRNDPAVQPLISEADRFYSNERVRLDGFSPLLLPTDEARRLMAAGEPPFAPIVDFSGADDRTIVVAERSVDVRVLIPPTVDAVYLHIHGGGWSLGSARYQDLRLWDLACEANVGVVSVDYRLTPEHPHPAGLEDCVTVASWLLDSSDKEFGSELIVIGGESAGAHLAVLTLIALRDRDGTTCVIGANLVSGIYDLSMTPSQRLWGSEPLIISTPILAGLYEQFAPGLTETELRDPSISPLYADLSGLPPALFTAGTSDPLIDDSLFMATRWHAAGNEVALDVYPYAAHGFIAQPIGLANLAHERTVNWIASRVDQHADRTDP